MTGLPMDPPLAELVARGIHYSAETTTLSQSDARAHEIHPHVHRVASLLKRWLLGTHHGAVTDHHLDAYLDEFVFCFNRRHSRNRGLVFCAWSAHSPRHVQPSPHNS